MAGFKLGRVTSDIRNTLSGLLREVKDPRVSKAFISVTGAEVTPDLKFAKIYYSAYNADKKEVKAGLRAASGFIRGQISKNLNLRITPELTFVEDGSIEYGAKISKILEGITFTDDEENGEEEN